MQPCVLALFLLSFSPTQALEAGTSPALPSQTATVTSLLPAQPSGNSTDPCAFPDRSTLLDRVVSEWQGYNITLLVETCPNVCVLVYGDGSPDVSGIGVSCLSHVPSLCCSITNSMEVLISYIMQFISTILVGPVLLYLSGFQRRCSDKLNRFVSMVIDEVMPTVNQGNNWIMFSILVASAFRLSAVPPVFETDFIVTLLWFQWILAVPRTINTCFLTTYDGDYNGRGVLSVVFLIFTLYFTFYLSSYGTAHGGRDQHQALVAISEFCAFGNDLPIPSPSIPEEETPRIPWWQYLLLKLTGPFVVMGVVAVCVIALVIIGLVLGTFFGLLAKIRDFFWAKSPSRLKEPLMHLKNWATVAWAMLFISLPGALWLAICAWLLATMQTARNSMQMALGKQYQDSYWGFGQILAAVLLFQPVFQIADKVFGRHRALFSC